MRNRRKGASNAGADGCRRGRKRRANSGTKGFTSGSRPKARSSASPEFIVSWAARPGFKHGPRGAKVRGQKTRNARGPRRGSGLKPALRGAAFTPRQHGQRNGALAENTFRKTRSHKSIEK